MSIIQINDKGVHVLELNKEAKETVIMIHGMFTNMSVFYFNIAPELAKYYHVVLYDLKSHGMSGHSESGYDLDSMAEDLKSLMDALDLKKAHLVGYSYGGLIALKMAQKFPLLIEKIAVIESPKPDEGETPEMLQKYGNEFIDQYLSNYESSIHLKPGKRQLEKNKKLFDYLFNESSIKEDFNKDNDFFDILSEKPLQHETLLLYGEKSDCVMAGDFLNQCLPSSLFYKGKGDHNLPVQNPRWISEKLIGFLK